MKSLMLQNRSLEYVEDEVNLGVDLVDDETDCFLCLRCERYVCCGCGFCFCFCFNIGVMDFETIA
jgi:hypothetical protein